MPSPPVDAQSANAIIRNAAVKIVGRLDAAEADEYRFLTPELRERASRFLPGTMVPSIIAMLEPRIAATSVARWTRVIADRSVLEVALLAIRSEAAELALRARRAVERGRRLPVRVRLAGPVATPVARRRVAGRVRATDARAAARARHG
jgi:hypothetical protein